MLLSIYKLNKFSNSEKTWTRHFRFEKLNCSQCHSKLNCLSWNERILGQRLFIKDFLDWRWGTYRRNCCGAVNETKEIFASFRILLNYFLNSDIMFFFLIFFFTFNCHVFDVIPLGKDFFYNWVSYPPILPTRSLYYQIIQLPGYKRLQTVALCESLDFS